MNKNLSLFEGYGIELEYMIVDVDSLSVKPVADEIIRTVAGSFVNEVARDAIAWSNELSLHVIELKTNGPVSSLQGLEHAFQTDIQFINKILQPMNACLLPTAMHPWMDPLKETVLWPHDFNPIYESYDRIFDCKGHGWSNLQSMHINLPFANDDEFMRLHSAIRVVLPLLPALAASSPIADGTVTGYSDSRLEMYEKNASKIPSITANVIPEFINSIQEYHDKILAPMYSDIAPYDKFGILQEEWLNSRGAIARFDRSAIEIRVVDIQECPVADITLAQFICSIIELLVHEELSTLKQQAQISTEELRSIYQNCVRDAEHARIENTNFLNLFGINRSDPVSAHDVLLLLVDYVGKHQNKFGDNFALLKKLVETGSLSTRIKQALAGDHSAKNLHKVYANLRDCLQSGVEFGDA